MKKGSFRIWGIAFFTTLLVCGIAAAVVVAGLRTQAVLTPFEGEPVAITRTETGGFAFSWYDKKWELPAIDLKPAAGFFEQYPALLPKPVAFAAFLLEQLDNDPQKELY